VVRDAEVKGFGVADAVVRDADARGEAFADVVAEAAARYRSSALAAVTGVESEIQRNP